MATDTTEGGDALIHLRVPAALKARWVRASRAAGMKLTDWIVEKTETTMNIDQLWAAKQAAEKIERAATAAHDAAEQLGSGPEYEAALATLEDARANLQAAEAAYDAAAALADKS